VRKLAEDFHTPPDRLSEDHIRRYFLYLKNDKSFAPGSLNIAYSGIKFVYTHTVPRPRETLKRVPRQRAEPRRRQFPSRSALLGIVSGGGAAW
jgi:hypothetical protein